MTTARVDTETVIATLREQLRIEQAQRDAEPPPTEPRRASVLHRLQAWLSR
jgi:hypothetical protein